MRINMPIQSYRDEASTNEKKAYNPPKLYRPLPLKTKEKATNEIYVGAMEPGRWDLFNTSEERVKKLGLNPDFKLCSPEGQPLVTFFFTLPLHRVSDMRRPDGSQGFTYVLCNKKMNNQLQTLLHNDKLFVNDKCAFCEEEAHYWGIFNAQWDVIGIKKDSVKGDREAWSNIVNNDKVMKAARAKAKEYSTSDRYLFDVFDLSKLYGKRPLDEGEESLQKQIWFAPKTIWESLCDIWHELSSAGVPMFHEIVNNQVFPLNLTKDTMDCSGNNFVSTKYKLATSIVRKDIDPAYGEYLTSPGTGCDPSDLFVVMSYDEQKSFVGSSNVGEEEPPEPPRATIPASPKMMPPPMNYKAPAPSEEDASEEPPVASQPVAPKMAPPIRPPKVSSPTRVVPSVTTGASIHDDDEPPSFVPGERGKW